MSQQKTFKLCLTMAGAVSAGAFTAGVLDYLLETLELWEKAKEKNRSLTPNHPEYDHTIPMHKVEIDVISGSSAGGITGTLTLLSLIDGNYKPVNKENPNGINNKFYESWVEMADDEKSDTIKKLLQRDDLKHYDEVRSLLNTEAIEVIANNALSIKKIKKTPQYASNSLDVILTTTNLRGLNFMVNFNGSEKNSINDNGTLITNHGGFLRYKLKNDTFKPGIPDDDESLYYVLDVSKEKDINYLKDATLSTAAFPIGLKSRKISISSEYIKRYPKYLFNKAKGVRAIIPEEDVYSFNSIDGGVINNEPYGIGLKVLHEKNDDLQSENNYAVVMIDPFPNKDHNISPSSGSSILDVAKGMFKALRNQVMFNQDGILEALDTSNRTKFLIEPIRKAEVNGKHERVKNDLASAPISGFAGFLSKEFRKHDFQLGRKNCQNFLRYYFAVKEENIEQRLGVNAHDKSKERFEFARPPRDSKGDKYFPIIPDMRMLRNFVELVDTDNYGEDAKIDLLPYPKISFTEFESKYKKDIKKRIGAIGNKLVKNKIFSLVNFFYLRGKLYKSVKESIFEELKDNDLLS